MAEIKCRGCAITFQDLPVTRSNLDENGWRCHLCGGEVIFWPSWVGCKGLVRIAEERKSQIEEHGWRPEHDAEHDDGALAWAAVCYAAPEIVYREKHGLRSIRFVDPWPWEAKWDRRKTTRRDIPMSTGQRRRARIRELTKAGALIAAEIDRLEALPEPLDPMAR